MVMVAKLRGTRTKGGSVGERSWDYYCIRVARDLAVTHPSLHLPKSFVFSFRDIRHTYEMRITRRSHTGIHSTSPALRQPTYAEAYAVVRKRKQAACKSNRFAQSTFGSSVRETRGFKSSLACLRGWPSKCAQRAVAGVLLRPMNRKYIRRERKKKRGGMEDTRVASARLSSDSKQKGLHHLRNSMIVGLASRATNHRDA